MAFGGERGLFDGAVSADAGNTREQGVAGDLARNGTAVELEADAVTGDPFEVVAIVN
jgi:hypothetical protein